MENYFHVTKRPTGWAVKRQGAARAISLHRTQQLAIEAATRFSKREHGELFIHGRDGRFRDRRSYGKDPFPPRG